MKKQEDRFRWIVGQLSERGGELNILDADFVDSYIDFTGAAHRVRHWGAAMCPLLVSDLRKMKRRYILRRERVGFSNPADGFPTWIWSYTADQCQISGDNSNPLWLAVYSMTETDVAKSSRRAALLPARV